MWAWWLIFLLCAAALGYFATWYFVNHRIPNPELSTEENSPDSTQLLALKFPRIRPVKFNNNLESRLQSIESKVNQYTNGQHDLMVKMARLEGMQTSPVKFNETDIADPNDEDAWEEMYYEAREAKEQLEEAAEANALMLAEKERMIAELMSKQNTENRSSTMSVQQQAAVNEKISELEKKLDSVLRERDALKSLASKQNDEKLNEVVKMENARLRSELDDMHKYADSLLRKSFQIEAKLEKLAKQKSDQSYKEDERSELRETVEEIFSENEKLALKIKELQDKLKGKGISHNPASLKL